MNWFNNGFWRIVGLDVCHLKGAYLGQILVVVGKHVNNNIFPIAWATVEIENIETWCWFIDLFMRDYDGGSNGIGFTFMSDRHKVKLFYHYAFISLISCSFSFPN